MFGGSRLYFLGCNIQMVDPVSTKQLTSILKIKHFKNKLSCLFDFSIFMDLVSLQIVAGEQSSSPAFKSFPHFGIQLVYQIVPHEYF
jgi:hypothetical protein